MKTVVCGSFESSARYRVREVSRGNGSAFVEFKGVGKISGLTSAVGADELLCACEDVSARMLASCGLSGAGYNGFALILVGPNVELEHRVRNVHECLLGGLCKTILKVIQHTVFYHRITGAVTDKHLIRFVEEGCGNVVYENVIFSLLVLEHLIGILGLVYLNRKVLGRGSSAVFEIEAKRNRVLKVSVYRGKRDLSISLGAGLLRCGDSVKILVVHAVYRVCSSVVQIGVSGIFGVIFEVRLRHSTVVEHCLNRFCSGLQA